VIQRNRLARQNVIQKLHPFMGRFIIRTCTNLLQKLFLITASEFGIKMGIYNMGTVTLFVELILQKTIYFFRFIYHTGSNGS